MANRQTPQFLVGVHVLSGWQVGYVVNTNGSITLGRSLSADQHNAAYSAIERLRACVAMTRVDCEFGIRVDRVEAA